MMLSSETMPRNKKDLGINNQFCILEKILHMFPILLSLNKYYFNKSDKRNVCS